MPSVDSMEALGAAVSRFPARLAEEDGELVLDLPVASEATVPQRPLPGHP